MGDTFGISVGVFLFLGQALDPRVKSRRVAENAGMGAGEESGK